MKISRHIYDVLLHLPCVPPEIGGILGSRNDEIDELVLDMTKNVHNKGIYEPNVSFLNKCIDEWNEQKITFQGMFHTHALNWPGLSSDDKTYVVQIMSAMPASIKKLYFPLVFPQDSIKVFYAEKRGNQIIISEEKIEIV